jgi:hypothetical protein
VQLAVKQSACMQSTMHAAVVGSSDQLRAAESVAIVTASILQQ